MNEMTVQIDSVETVNGKIYAKDAVLCDEIAYNSGGEFFTVYVTKESVSVGSCYGRIKFLKNKDGVFCDMVLPLMLGGYSFVNKENIEQMKKVIAFYESR